ncbi:sialic acid synthase-like protein [Hyaloraphidium curvatum]|nr:sialic acid synthase-like protein [Hyaloraphidium curvatum]
MGPAVELVPGRWVGPGRPTFFIAEAGLNHNGRLDAALRLVDAAKAAGADAVKFQKRTPASMLTRAALAAPYAGPHSFGATYGEHRAALELSEADWDALAAHAARAGIALAGSAWDEASADLLVHLGAPFLKLPSADLTNFPLMAHAARSGRPLVLSTGMADMALVRRAVAHASAFTTRLVLLHCTSTYPAPPEACNLRAIHALATTFPDVVVGYSGHEQGTAIACAAAAIGAAVVEKHLTLDRQMKGPDHAASLEPEEFADMVRRVREAERAMGDGIKRLMPGEDAVRAKLAKSLVAAHDIPRGTVLTPEMLVAKGPGTGIAVCDAELVLGRMVLRDIAADTLLDPTMFG